MEPNPPHTTKATGPAPAPVAAPVPTVTVQLDAGTVLGDWRIDGLIGIGGMGTVYAATHSVIGKRAAIKVVRAELCEDRLTAERLVQEAWVVNQVGHPAIIDIFHIGTLDDGRPYLVMELLHGRTLGQRLAAGRLLATDAIDILLQVSSGLAAAHASGVVHRDLKPDNIFLVDGAAGVEVKLVDWGIAKLMDVPPMSGDLTTTGTLVGTPQYMSPEQARGKSVDGRTDVYGLGAIAYEMFLEGPPFSSDNVADLVVMQLREPPPPPSELWPDIPAELEALLLAMLAKRPEGRPALEEIERTLRGLRDHLGTRRCTSRSLRALAAPAALDDLDRVPTWGMTELAPAVAVIRPPTRRRGRRPAVEAFAALATFLMLAGAGVTATHLSDDPRVLARAARDARGAATAHSPASLVPPDIEPAPVEGIAPPTAAPTAAPRKHVPERRRAVLDPDGTIDPFE